MNLYGFIYQVATSKQVRQSAQEDLPATLQQAGVEVDADTLQALRQILAQPEKLASLLAAGISGPEAGPDWAIIQPQTC